MLAYVELLGMGDSPPLITWGTFAIAVIGVVQPYAFAAWRRWSRKRDITVYHSLLPDVGFTGVGLCCGLSGTIATRNAASLITSIQLRAQRAGGEPECVLDAYLNRKRSISNEGGGKDSVEGEIWVPFKADADAAYPYDIMFVDTATKTRLDLTGADLRAAWQAYAIPILQREIAAGTLTPDQQADRALQLFPAFQQQPIYADTAQRIRNDIAWRAGDYRLLMDVRCAEDRRTFRQEWTFVLSPADAAMIGNNVEILQAYMCEIPPAIVGNLLFAYPQLQRGPASTLTA